MTLNRYKPWLLSWPFGPADAVKHNAAVNHGSDGASPYHPQGTNCFVEDYST
jgi:hypothetical protein